MSAIASFSMLLKAFDWMRLFDLTSFYVLLILQTIKDISAFLLLLIMSLVMFGVPMIILNMNRSEDQLVVDEIFGSWIQNMFINQYLLALGEFNVDNFNQSS